MEVVIAGRKCEVNEDVEDRRPTRFRVIIRVPGMKMRGPDGHELDIRGFGENIETAHRDALSKMPMVSRIVA